MATEITVLKRGTLTCPMCTSHLHFHVVGPMRLKELINGVYLYDGFCPNTICVKHLEHVKVIADTQE